MKLKDCVTGVPVVTKDYEVGHIVGFAYSLSYDVLASCKPMSNKDLFDNHLVPLVRFATGQERGVHHGNIERLK